MPVVDTQPHHPLLWSETKIAQHEREVHSISEADFLHWTKRAELCAACGDVGAARVMVERALDIFGTGLLQQNSHFFTEIVVASLLSCQYDIVYSAFSQKFRDLWIWSIEVEEGTSRVPHAIDWEVLGSDRSIFRFDTSIYHSDAAHNIFVNWVWSYPLFQTYHASRFLVPGLTRFTFGDMAAAPGLAFSGFQPDVFLVPDCLFLSQLAYRDAAAEIKQHARPWRARAPVAHWRGSTTGIKLGDWRTLQRIRLCQIAQAHESSAWFDVGITTIAQMENEQWVKEIEQAGLTRPFVPCGKFAHYKYLIDVDGNSNAWQGLFTKLLTGSTVLKVASPLGFRQWYYDRLQPWVNYVPVVEDMSDLVENLEWLAAHDDQAELIGKRGKALAESMTVDRELASSVHTIADSIRFFKHNS